MPAVKKLLTAIKIPVDKIASTSSINRAIRYGTLGVLGLGSYLCFSGDSVYQGHILKEYNILPEKISENIKQKGLIVPTEGIVVINTKKLTRDMVDNGIYSRTLINNSIDEYIAANIEKLIDLDASLNKVVLADFANISKELATLAKKELTVFNGIRQVKSEDFINVNEMLMKS